jgi:nitrate/TMAO reductase-like tetraheme cytochrome c subunit
MSGEGEAGGALRRLWRALWRPAAKWSLGGLLLIGGLGGVVAWGGFNTAMEASNSMAFCISCHEMKDNVYQEYTQTVHFKNASGVRATCADCHVPSDWGPKLVRKVQATNELWHTMLGSIDTPEKFEAKRPVLAQHVWDAMKANDSRECRNCHSFDAMDFHKQRARSREKMEGAAAKGETCIDCHKGIAHRLPPRDD